MVWDGLIRSGLAHVKGSKYNWPGLVQLCLTWFGQVYSDMVWPGVVWSGLVWSGVVWSDLA